MHDAGFIIEVNDNFEQLFGFTAAEVIGKHMTDNIALPEDADALAKHFQDPPQPIYDRVLRRKNGPTFSAEMRAKELVYRGRNVRIVSVRDVTERKRNLETLRFMADASIMLTRSLDLEAIFAQITGFLVSRFADSCFIHKLQEDGSIHQVALAHVDPARQALLAEIEQYYPSRSDADCGYAKVIRTGEAEFIPEISDEMRNALAQKPEHLALLKRLGTVSSIAIPLKIQDKIWGALTVTMDKSRRYYTMNDFTLLEDLVRHIAVLIQNVQLYEALQDAVRFRDEFLAVASHELKSPITSLRGFAQMSLRQVRKGEINPQTIQRSLEVIEKQTNRLSNYITELLDVSRISTDRLIIHREQTDIVSLAEDLVQVLQTTTTKHLIQLHAPDSVVANFDPLRIEQVTANLINNSIRYSPQGGPIDVEISTPSENSVRIAVRDRGVGIPEGQRTNLFDRFYQGLEKGYSGGMGVGLYISKHIIDLHDGRIWAEFPEEGGTVFLVELPKNEQAGQTSQKG
jgi:PAS domain S-box-containing protein